VYFLEILSSCGRQENRKQSPSHLPKLSTGPWLLQHVNSPGLDAYLDLQVHLKPVTLFCDNQAALHIAANLVYHECTKHIKIDYHIVREKIQASQIVMKFVPFYLQLADIFTKALGGDNFKKLTSKLNILNIHAPT
jgi:hypothetical protein